MSQRLTCPTDNNHIAGMIYERYQGVATGRLVAVCFDCNRELPPERELPVVPLSDDERAALEQAERKARTEAARKAAAAKAAQNGEWSRQPTPDQRRRDAEIRLAWGRGAAVTTLVQRYEISANRIYQIIQGRKRSA